MPELPDVLLYIESLEPRILRQQLERVRLASPFVVRSVAPPLSRIHGRTVRTLSRLGKQIIWEFDGDLFLVVHLMIAGRFQWKERYARIPGKLGLAAFDFPTGTLLLTEAGSKKRAPSHPGPDRAMRASLIRLQSEAACRSESRTQQDPACLECGLPFPSIGSGRRSSGE